MRIGMHPRVASTVPEVETPSSVPRELPRPPTPPRGLRRERVDVETRAQGGHGGPAGGNETLYTFANIHPEQL